MLLSLVFFSLFCSMLLTFAVSFAEQHDASMENIGGGALNISKFDASISTINDTSSDYRQRFESGDVDDVDDASGIFAIVTDIVSLIVTPFSLLAEVMQNLLGIPVLFTSVVLGILGISLILSIWRVLRSGD